MRVLICGDSFSARTGKGGWPELLEKDFEITNISQSGCSEYRILKQIESVDLSQFNVVLINHTSPFRVYIKEHPIHKNSSLHHSCDLLYEDVTAHASHKVMKVAKDYFEHIFDIDHAKDMYSLILEKIQSLTNNIPTIHCSHLEWDNLHHFNRFVYLNTIWVNNRGSVNHYSAEGNSIIYDIIKSELVKTDIRT